MHRKSEGRGSEGDVIESRPSSTGGLGEAAARSCDERAAIACAAWAGVATVEELAQRHGVPAADVAAWRDCLAAGAPRLFDAERHAAADPATRILAPLDDLEMCIAVLEGEALRYVYANRRYCALAGDAAPLIGRRLREVFPFAIDDGVEAGMLDVLATGVPWHVARFAAPVPGEADAVWEGHVARVAPAQPGGLAAVIVWVRNITGTVRAEDRLRDELALLRAISDSSDDVIFAKDAEGRLRFANPATLALIGKPFEAIAGLTDAQFLDNADVAREVMCNDRRIMDSGVAEDVEEPVPLPDGSHRIWLSSKRPYRDERGRVIGLLGISRDITVRKAQEVQLQQAHAALQRVLDSITDGLAILDLEWRYTYFSETAARMLGVRGEDLIGRVLWDVYPEAADLPFGREYRRAVETGVATHFEAYYPEPLNVWLECHCYPSSDGLSVYFRDVTERRRAEDAADANRRRVDAMLEATPVGLAYADAHGRVMRMNAECRRLWGDPPTALSVDDYIEFKGWWADDSERHGHLLAATEWPMARALAGEHVVDALIEIEPFNARGVRRTCLLRSVPVRNADGEITGAVTAQTDITEEVQAKAALEASSRQLRQLANTIPQLAWMADASGAIHWYNDRWYAYTGTSPAEMEGWGWQSVHDPAALPDVLERWNHSLATGERFEMTFPLRGRDGAFHPFFTLAEPLRDAAGRVVQWFGTNTDVSALESVQAELRTTQHWLQAGLDAGRMVAWEWQLREDRVRYSHNVAEVMGYAGDSDAAGWASLVPEDRERLESVMRDAIATRGAFDEITRRVRPDDGRTLWVRTKGHAVTDEAGTPVSLRGILIDLTEQIARQQALEDADRRKDEFLAMLAHELRNPLAPISTAAQLLTMGPPDTPRVRASASVIVRQVRHMTSLVDDLLDVSRVTRGLVQLDRHDLDVDDLLDSAVEQSRPLIEARGHTLRLPAAPASAVVHGDRVRLVQVLANLLNNAAKYTPEGGVIAVGVDVPDGCVRWTVTDTGIGIEPELLPHVFELFTQAARTSDRAQGGLGLGLALVESLVRMHGGRVEAASDGPGRGSRFSVTLPTVQASVDARRGEAEEAVPAPARALAVLIVDDNVDSTQMLQAVLELDGHRVIAAHRPSQALASARHQRFDVAVLDVGLPEMDGYALAGQLQTLPEFEGTVLVALTGYGQAQDRTRSRAAGFEHHLVKPVDYARLREILVAAAQRRGA